MDGLVGLAGAAAEKGAGIENGLGPSRAGAYHAAADQEKVEAETYCDVDEQHAHEAEGDVDNVGGRQFADHFGDNEQENSRQADLNEAFASGFALELLGAPTIQPSVPGQERFSGTAE